jgi:adenylate cyclase
MAEPTEQGKIEIGHVLIMGVVGYSKLLIDEQSPVIGELNRIVRGTVRFRVVQAAGKLISFSTGDGMALVFFGDPEAALECAMEIAVALKAHPQIRLRMGAHSGPVNRVTDVSEGSNVAGASIDMARRVMDCGDAGHILLSRGVAYDLAPSPRWGAHLYELGDYEVKHGQKISLVNFYTAEIGNPTVPAKIKRARAEALAREKRIAGLPRPLAAAIGVLLALILSAGLFFFQQYLKKLAAGPLPPPVPEKSIAVLPFTDLSPAKDQQYFCDGISEEILDALARIEGLRVVARTSSFSFRETNEETNEIGRKLNVATVLEGSLRRDGNRIRITAQLINARDGFHIWSETFERELEGVFAVQDEITRKIVDGLKIKLAVVPPARPPQDTEAYDLYLKGLYFSNKSSEENLCASLGLFEKALEKDAKLGRAWTGIAKAWISLADAYARPLDAYSRAQAAAEKALVIDERDAEAHAYLGEAKRILAYDCKGEEAELKRALEIDPNSAVAHLFMALLRMSLGESAAGLAEIRTAVRLDPLSPIVGNFEVLVDVANDRLDEAFAAAKRTMEIDPDYVYFEPDLALVYREQGKLREALDIYQRLEKTRNQASAGLAITYVRLGRKEEARRVLTKLVELADTRYFPAEQIASVYVALGDKEAAFHWIERAITEHSAPLYLVGVAPEFRALRSDPRFSDVLRRIGLDPARLLSGKK